MTAVILVLVFIILIMLGLALFFQDNLGDVFLTNRNFVAAIISVAIIAISYVILLYPTPFEPLNQLFSLFSTAPFILALVGGGFMMFFGLLMETIVLFFVIRAFLNTKKDLNKKKFS